MHSNDHALNGENGGHSANAPPEVFLTPQGVTEHLSQKVFSFDWKLGLRPGGPGSALHTGYCRIRRAGP